jgi:RNA polymerase sigma factor (sigma-70 family)
MKTPSTDAASSDAEFSDFYERVFPQVYAFLRTQTPRPEVVQELTSTVFLKACRHWPHAPRGEAATFWIFKIARTTLIDYWRVEGRRDAVNVSLDELSETSESGDDPEGICAAKERSRALVRAASTLGEADRVLIALKFVGQRSNHHIAGILGISEAAVSMRLGRALRRLRDRLQEAGYREA